VAFDYLERLGVDIANRVSLVVATHWHDDHIGGFGELFEACKNARFACSMAMNCKEWSTLVEIYRSYVQAGGSGVDELGRAMRELNRRAQRREVVAPNFCITGRLLRDRRDALAAKISCLAPSDAAVGTMQARIRKELLPQIKGRRLRVPVLSENDSAVVLAVSVGTASVLLGADLEERNRPGLGWQVILDEYPPEGQRFDGFKMPHHGSMTGHHPETWGRLMRSPGWAAVTPFNRQKEPLPRPADCARILAMTEDAFITAPPGLGKFKHHEAAVQRTVQEATIAIGPEPGKQGHVRFRKAANLCSEKWTVELFGHALPLSALR
jgi:Metallo-beta-lactamase superfamily